MKVDLDLPQDEDLIVDLLKKKKLDYKDALFTFIKENRKDLIELLFDVYGCDLDFYFTLTPRVNHRDYDTLKAYFEDNWHETFFQTPFMSAISYGHENLVCYFISLNEDIVNQKNEYGYTPITAAFFSDNIDMVQILLATEKCDFYQELETGFPLEFLFDNENHEGIKFLLETGKVDFNQHKERWIEYHDYCKNHEPEMLQLLEDHEFKKIID